MSHGKLLLLDSDVHQKAPSTSARSTEQTIEKLLHKFPFLGEIFGLRLELSNIGNLPLMLELIRWWECIYHSHCIKEVWTEFTIWRRRVTRWWIRNPFHTTCVLNPRDKSDFSYKETAGEFDINSNENCLDRKPYVHINGRTIFAREVNHRFCGYCCVSGMRARYYIVQLSP